MEETLVQVTNFPYSSSVDIISSVDIAYCVEIVSTNVFYILACLLAVFPVIILIRKMIFFGLEIVNTGVFRDGGSFFDKYLTRDKTSDEFKGLSIFNSKFFRR